MKEKLTNFVRSLNFTNKEIKVVLFIVIVVIAGFVIKIINLKSAEAERYNYSRTDSIFKVLSTRNDIAAQDTSQADSNLYLKERQLLAATDSLNSSGKKGSKYSKENFLKDSKIDINTCSKADLTKLPGVGEATAEKIIEFRKNKPFRKPEDIMNISGIGEKKFDKMKNYIKTEK